MPIVPVRQRDCFRLMASNQIDGVGDELGRFGDATVGPAQVFAPGGAEYVGGGGRFAQPDFRRPVAAQLAGGQIAETDRSSFSRMTSDGSAQANLNVVGVWPEHQQVNGHVLPTLSQNV